MLSLPVLLFAGSFVKVMSLDGTFKTKHTNILPREPRRIYAGQIAQDRLCLPQMIMRFVGLDKLLMITLLMKKPCMPCIHYYTFEYYCIILLSLISHLFYASFYSRVILRYIKNMSPVLNLC